MFHRTSSLEAAAEAAAKVNAMLIAKGKLKTQAIITQSKTKEITSSKTTGDLYTAEVEINDAPLAARNLLTRGLTQDEINKYSGAAVSTRGRYVNFEEKAKNTGERPLYLYVQASEKEAVDLGVQRIQEIIQQHMTHQPTAVTMPVVTTSVVMSQTVQRRPSKFHSKFSARNPNSTQQIVLRPPPLMSLQTSMPSMEKVFVCLDHAGPGFDLRNKVVGIGGANLHYIRNESGAMVTLRGKGSGFIEPTTGTESPEPMHLCIEHPKFEGLQAGKQLAQNLVDTLQQEFLQWHQQQAAQQQQLGNMAVAAAAMQQTTLHPAQFQTVSVTGIGQPGVVTIHQQIPQQEMLQAAGMPGLVATSVSLPVNNVPNILQNQIAQPVNQMHQPPPNVQQNMPPPTHMLPPPHMQPMVPPPQAQQQFHMVPTSMQQMQTQQPPPITVSLAPSQPPPNLSMVVSSANIVQQPAQQGQPPPMMQHGPPSQQVQQVNNTLTQYQLPPQQIMYNSPPQMPPPGVHPQPQQQQIGLPPAQQPSGMYNYPYAPMQGLPPPNNGAPMPVPFPGYPGGFRQEVPPQHMHPSQNPGNIPPQGIQMPPGTLSSMQQQLPPPPNQQGPPLHHQMGQIPSMGKPPPSAQKRRFSEHIVDGTENFQGPVQGMASLMGQPPPPPPSHSPNRPGNGMHQELMMGNHMAAQGIQQQQQQSGAQSQSNQQPQGGPPPHPHSHPPPQQSGPQGQQNCQQSSTQQTASQQDQGNQQPERDKQLMPPPPPPPMSTGDTKRPMTSGEPEHKRRKGGNVSPSAANMRPGLGYDPEEQEDDQQDNDDRVDNQHGRGTNSPSQFGIPRNNANNYTQKTTFNHYSSKPQLYTAPPFQGANMHMYQPPPPPPPSQQHLHQPPPLGPPQQLSQLIPPPPPPPPLIQQQQATQAPPHNTYAAPPMHFNTGGYQGNNSLPFWMVPQ